MTSPRLLSLGLTCLVLGWSISSCATSAEIFADPDARAGAGGAVVDAGPDVSDGGLGGTAGQGGMAGLAGLGGAGGDGLGGDGMSGAGGGGAGGAPATCNPSFCPSTFGSPCCLTPQGPCGCDMGMGCMSCTMQGG